MKAICQVTDYIQQIMLFSILGKIAKDMIILKFKR